jgi:hypothetical protein
MVQAELMIALYFQLSEKSSLEPDLAACNFRD